MRNLIGKTASREFENAIWAAVADGAECDIVVYLTRDVSDGTPINFKITRGIDALAQWIHDDIFAYRVDNTTNLETVLSVSYALRHVCGQPGGEV